MSFKNAAMGAVKGLRKSLKPYLRKRQKKLIDLSRKEGVIDLNGDDDRGVISRKECATLQEAMMYASAATLLDLGFDLEKTLVVDEVDSDKTEVKFEFVAYTEVPEVVGTVKELSYGDATAFSGSAEDLATGTYL